MKSTGQAFNDLRASLENNMRHIYRVDEINESQAGHYPAVVLIVVGSQALSVLQGHGKKVDHVFVEMMAEHGVEGPLAQQLFDALRNGLAHVWDTKFLDVGEQELVEVVVSWEKQQHLSLRSSPPGLYLNVATMWGDLQKALAKFAAVLEGNPERAGSPAPRSVTSITASPETREAWRRFQVRAPLEVTP